MKSAHILILILAVLLASSVIFFQGTRISEAQTNCSVDCLNDKITALTVRVAALEKKLAATTGTSKKTAATSQTAFVNLPNGSSDGTDWQNIPNGDFWFDLALWGNVTSVTWEGWLTGGWVRARLYDATNSRVVDNSEVEINSADSASFYSKPLAIWRGQNHYVVQIKNMVAGPASIATPRLRLILK